VEGVMVESVIADVVLGVAVEVLCGKVLIDYC